MAAGGEHIIKGVPKWEPPPPRNEGASIGAFIFWAILLFGILTSLAGGSGGGSSQSKAPVPPRPRAALIKAVGDTPFLLSIAGAGYDIEYISQDLLDAQGGTIDPPVVTADFEAKKVTGDLALARTLVLRGDLELHVGSIEDVSHLVAKITTQDKVIGAYFNYAQSPTGPPGAMVDEASNQHRRIKVIIVGAMKEIDFGHTYGHSQLNVSYQPA